MCVVNFLRARVLLLLIFACFLTTSELSSEPSFNVLPGRVKERPVTDGFKVSVVDVEQHASFM